MVWVNVAHQPSVDGWK